MASSHTDLDMAAECASLRQRVAELEAQQHALQTALDDCQESYQQLRAVFESTGLGIALALPNGQIVDSNSAFRQLLGYTNQELQQCSALDITCPADLATEMDLVAEVLAGRRDTYQLEKRFICKNGAVLWVQLTNSVLRHSDGSLRYGIGVVEDISQRKQMEHALAMSEKRYRMLVETLPSALLLTTLEGTIQFCNEQAADLFGYPAAAALCGVQVQGLTCLAAETDDATMLDAWRAADTPIVRNVVYSMCRRDGRPFPAEITTAVVTDSQGQPESLIILVRDVSDHQRTRQKLTTAYDDLRRLNEMVTMSRNLLRALFDGLPDGLALLDHCGIIRTVNKRLSSLLGYAPDALVGRSWATIAAHLLPSETSSTLQPLRGRSNSHTRRLRCRDSDEVLRVLDMQMIALPGQDPSASQVIVHIADVTESLQLQERVLENERFAASGKLAASVAHEINTPLQSIELFLDMLHDASSEAHASYLGYARQELQWVGQIVRQLLDLYRPAAAVPGPVDINTLLERMLLLLGRRLNSQGVEVQRALAEDLPRVWGQANEVMQVLMNLLVNALDAMPHGGRLRLHTASEPAGMVCIQVADTGGGIVPDLHARIFEPFVTTKEQGTGLGLAISSQIVQQHGGSISVASTPGQGACFMVRLPCATVASARMASQPQP